MTLHGAWLDALRDVSVGIRSGHVVVLVGLPGVGKTSLLQALFALLEQAGRPVGFLAPGQMPAPGAVLLADDAHRLGEAALQAVLDHPAACVLAGEPALAMLTAGLPRRVTAVTLHPLPPEAAAGFVAALLQGGGEAGRVFASPAVRAGHVEQAWAKQERPPGPNTPAGLPDAARASEAALPPKRAADAVPWKRRIVPWPAAAAIGLVSLAVMLGWPRHPGPLPGLAPQPTMLPSVQPKAETVPEPATTPEPALPAASAAGPASLPAAVPLHVTLAVPRRTAERAAQLTGMLAGLGYDVTGQRHAAFRSANLEVRYFYAEDATAAAQLAAAVGAGPDAVHLAAPSPNILSAPGAVEVMVPSAAAARSALPSVLANPGD